MHIESTASGKTLYITNRFWFHWFYKDQRFSWMKLWDIDLDFGHRAIHTKYCILAWAKPREEMQE